MRNILTLAWLTFHEALRRKMVLAGLLLGLVFIGLYSLGLVFLLDQASQVNGISTIAAKQLGLSFLTIAGLYVVHFLTIMLAIFASVDTISGEITSHTIQAIATKPVRRWEIVIGKWAGYLVMIVPYSILLGLGIVLSMYGLTGFVTPNIGAVMGLLALQAVVLLSFSLLGGTRFSTLTNGVVLFMLYGLAFIGSWIEQIGALFQAQAAVDIGIVTSLVMPVEALWRLAVGLVEPPLLATLNSPMIMFGGSSTPSGVMVAYSVALALVVLGLAVRRFSTRDL